MSLVQSKEQRNKTKNKIGILLIVVIVIAVSIKVVPNIISTRKFNEMFNDSSILLNGYTQSGLTYLSIYPTTARLDHGTGSENFKGKVKIIGSNRLNIKFENGETISCDVLSNIVLDCDGAVFRRFDSGIDKETCELSLEESQSAISDGYARAYNNPYDKLDACYQEYDSNYHTGIYNDELNHQRAEDRIHNTNGCLSLNGHCVNMER